MELARLMSYKSQIKKKKKKIRYLGYSESIYLQYTLQGISPPYTWNPG